MKFVGYVRVSTKSQVLNGANGLETQKNIISEFVKKTYNIDVIPIKEEIGSSYNDKEKLQILKECIKPKTTILISDITRFGRNIDQLHDNLKLATKKECKIHSILENMTFGNNKIEDNDFIVKTLHSVQYSNMLSEKIKRSVERRKENGEFIGKPPFGYKKINKKLVFDTEEQQIIKRIYELLATRHKYVDIAKILHCENIKGKKWSGAIVKNIIMKHKFILEKYFNNVEFTLNENNFSDNKMDIGNNQIEKVNYATENDYNLLDAENKKKILGINLSSLNAELMKIVMDFNERNILKKVWEEKTVKEMIENTKLPKYFK